jgi:elongator complex protein 3
MLKKEIIVEIAKAAKKAKTQDQFNKIKHKIARAHHLPHIPKNAEILSSLTKAQRSPIQHLLLSKPVRTISGVAPIAIMTAPIACPPQAKCTYCPGGPSSFFGDVPKSYTGGAPAVRRAIRNQYDPYLQVFNRLEHYFLLNHNPTKVELIVMGGTFPHFPKKYRDQFITYALKAMNDFSKLFYTKKNEFSQTKFNKFFMLPGDKDSKERLNLLKQKILKLKTKTSLEKEKEINQTSNIRCTALVLETRPDCSLKKEINQMLKVGTTRVELGVQTLNNQILKKIKRGHPLETTIQATQLLKDSFLKVSYHMMLGLPLTTRISDISAFKELFSNQNYKPDSLKIYPCLVMAGTKLLQDYKKGLFKPISTNQAIQRIAQIKKYIPEYCRIMRIQRDIPTHMTEAGVDKTNLRQMLQLKNIKCQCIRCREPRNKKIDYNHIKTKIQEYQSSNGTEVFISKEDTKNNILLAYTRLRIPFKPFRPEITKKSAGIRELHVFGQALDIKQQPTSKKQIQHRGFGKELIQTAEKIAKEKFDINKLLVISGIGVRQYYKQQLRYKLDGPYMSKKI